MLRHDTNNDTNTITRWRALAIYHEITKSADLEDVLQSESPFDVTPIEFYRSLERQGLER